MATMLNLNLDTLQAGLRTSNVPEHMHNGLILWLTEGIRPGSFMMAVLENDLREACSRADNTNRYRLFDFVSFLYNYAPFGAWGSPKACDLWAKDRRAEREARS